MLTQLGTCEEQLDSLEEGDAKKELEVAGQENSTARVKKLAKLARLQQQQLAALRLRLARRDRQLLAMSGRDGGKALILAEHEAATAQAEVSKKNIEIDELQKSLLQLEYHQSRAAPLTSGSMMGSFGRGNPSAGSTHQAAVDALGGDGSAAQLPENVAKFIAEKARESASIKEQLGRMTRGIQAAERQWSALEKDRDAARREVDVLRHAADAAKRLVGIANEEAFSRKREADEDRVKLEGRLGELARLSQANVNSGRAKAAEFVVERLKQARERVETLERQNHDQAIELRSSSSWSWPVNSSTVRASSASTVWVAVARPLVARAAAVEALARVSSCWSQGWRTSCVSSVRSAIQSTPKSRRA